MIAWLSPTDPFPPLDQALPAGSDAPGLLAASDDLTPERLQAAYHRGIFPWYSDGQPVLWWSPDPRMTLRPSAFKVSASLRKTLKRVLHDPDWAIRVDVDFPAVMRLCASAPREGQDGTWITSPVVAAYTALHTRGRAHSVEVWYEDQRVGGLYGVAIGKMFFGESMFAHRTDASKIALSALCAHLIAQGVEMIDCQQNTRHLASLGGVEMKRTNFIEHLRIACEAPPIRWDFDKQVLTHWIDGARRAALQAI